MVSTFPTKTKKNNFFFWFINKVPLGFLPRSLMSNPSLCHIHICPGKERYRHSQKWKAMSVEPFPSNSTGLINVCYLKRGIRSEPGSAPRGAERASLPCYSVASLLLQSKAACVKISWVGQGVMISQLGGSSLPKDICLLQINQLCKNLILQNFFLHSNRLKVIFPLFCKLKEIFNFEQ